MHQHLQHTSMPKSVNIRTTLSMAYQSPLPHQNLSLQIQSAIQTAITTAMTQQLSAMVADNNPHTDILHDKNQYAQTADSVIVVLELYNKLYEQYQCMQGQYQNQQAQAEHKCREQMAKFADEYKLTIDSLNYRHKKQQAELQSALARSQHKQVQMQSKMHALQAQIEKYQYQLHQRDSAMAAIVAEIERGEWQATAEAGEWQARRVDWEGQMEGSNKEGQDWDRVQEGYREALGVLVQASERMQSRSQARSRSQRENQDSIENGFDEQLLSLLLPADLDNQYRQVFLQLKSQHQQLNSHISSLLARLKALNLSHSNLKHRYCTVLKQTQSKIHQLNTHNSDLQHQLASLTSKLVILTDSNQSLTLNSTTLRTRNHQLTLLTTDQQQQLHTLQQQYNALEQLHNALSVQNQSLKESLGAIREGLSVGEGEAEGVIVQHMIQRSYGIRVENGRIRGEMDRMVADMRHQDGEIKQKEAEIGRLGRAIEQKSKEMERLDRVVRDKQSRLEQKEQKIKQLEIRLASMSELSRQQMTSFQASTAALRDELQATTTQVQQLSTQPISHSLVNYQTMQILSAQKNVLQQIVNSINNKQHEQKYAQVDLCPHQEPETTPDPHNDTKRYSVSPVHRASTRSQAKPGQLVDRTRHQPNNTPHPEDIDQLGKTCKLRPSTTHTPMTQIQQLNDIINYMVNYMKGYTRNGIRGACWLSAQGEEYLARLHNGKNIRQKYSLFERVRELALRNQECRQLVRDFERIAGYYFAVLEELGAGDLLDGKEKENWELNTEASHIRSLKGGKEPVQFRQR